MRSCAGSVWTTESTNLPSREMSNASAFAELHDGRSVGLAQAGRVVGAHGSAHLGEEERLAVGRQRPGVAQVEPGEVALAVRPGCEDRGLPPLVVAARDPAAVGGDVENRQPARALDRGAPLSVEGHGVDLEVVVGGAGGEHDLAAVGRPGEPFLSPVAVARASSSFPRDPRRRPSRGRRTGSDARRRRCGRPCARSAGC